MTGGRDRFTTRFLFKFGHVLTTDNIYKYKLFEFLLIVFLNTKYLNVNIVISLGRVWEVCDIMQVRERVVYCVISCKLERELFIGTQFSNLHPAVCKLTLELMKMRGQRGNRKREKERDPAAP